MITAITSPKPAMQNADTAFAGASLPATSPSTGVQTVDIDLAERSYPIRIGAGVMIGPNVQIYTAAHALEADERLQGVETALPVTIEDRVWIGGGAILLPGVTIGREAIVGAGAVVSKDVPAGARVVGNPARILPARAEG